MTSTIKVNNIQNQCGGAVVTKCGGTTTISGTVVKSNTLQASDAGNIISQSGTTITLGASGDSIALASGASQSGFGRTGTVDWQTGSIKTSSPFTAVAGEGYFVNTTGGVVTVNLPAGVAGAIVGIKDYAGTFGSNAVTLSPNGSDKIGGGSVVDPTLTINGESILLVFVDSTQGWLTTQQSVTETPSGAPTPFIQATGGTIVDSGDYRTHIFTGSGSLSATAGTVPSNNTADYIVVAGGGSGGYQASGGGGAGGFRLSNELAISSPTMSPLSNGTGITISTQAYPITVGAGGAQPLYVSGNGPANPGSNSIFSTITSTGGGGGSGGTGEPSMTAGDNGGSGGGGKGAAGGGGTGNTPPVSPAQGTNGSTGVDGTVAFTKGGGGGGASAAAPGPGSPGGAGSFLADAFIGPTAPSYGTPGPVGSTRYFSGGGGSGRDNGTPGGAGGTGGGGAGGGSPFIDGTVGTVNTGGGGGGGGNTTNVPGAPFKGSGATGGSGIVMIRYKFQ
jgi:hypothetical protein